MPSGGVQAEERDVAGRMEVCGVRGVEGVTRSFGRAENSVDGGRNTEENAEEAGKERIFRR